MASQALVEVVYNYIDENYAKYEHDKVRPLQEAKPHFKEILKVCAELEKSKLPALVTEVISEVSVKLNQVKDRTLELENEYDRGFEIRR